MEKMKFLDFEPDQNLLRKAQLSLQYIQERAPSDARIKAQMKKVADLYECTVEVVSSSCSFSYKTFHRFASTAVEKIEGLSLRRLSRWRGNRFLQWDSFPRRTSIRLAK